MLYFSAINERDHKQTVQTIDSLNKAVVEAGGVYFSYEIMKEMSLFEFIWKVAAPNHLKFYCEKPNEGECDGSM